MYINIRDEYYNDILNGDKTIEGRLCRGKFCSISEGDFLIFKNSTNGSIATIVQKVVKYKSFEDGLSNGRLKKMLPRTSTVEEGANIYRSIYKDGDKEFGFCLIYIIKDDCMRMSSDDNKIYFTHEGNIKKSVSYKIDKNKMTLYDLDISGYVDCIFTKINRKYGTYLISIETTLDSDYIGIQRNGYTITKIDKNKITLQNGV